MNDPKQLDAQAIQTSVEAWPHGNAENAIRAILRGLDSKPAYRVQFSALRAGLLSALEDQQNLNAAMGLN